MALPKPKQPQFNIASIPAPTQWSDWSTFKKQIMDQAAAAGQTVNGDQLLAYYTKNVAPIKAKQQQEEQKKAIQAQKDKAAQDKAAREQKALADKAAREKAAADANKAKQAKIDADKAAADAKAAAKKQADEAKAAEQKQKQLDQQKAAEQKMADWKAKMQPAVSNIGNTVNKIGNTVKTAFNNVTSSVASAAPTPPGTTPPATNGPTWIRWKDYWAAEKAKGTKITDALRYWNQNIAKLNPALPQNRNKPVTPGPSAVEPSAAGPSAVEPSAGDTNTPELTAAEPSASAEDYQQQLNDLWNSWQSGGGGGGGYYTPPATTTTDTGTTTPAVTAAEPASAASPAFDVGNFVRNMGPSYWNMNKARNNYWENTFASPATAASGVTQSNNPLGWTGFFTPNNPYATQ